MAETELLNQLRVSEHALQAAQLASDADALDVLIDDELIFTGPDGSLLSKSDDLDAHRTGQQRLERSVQLDLQARVFGSTGVTWVLMAMEGSIAGTPFVANIRYTRTWSHEKTTGWIVVAAHASIAAET